MADHELSIGKIQRLRRCASPSGHFVMLALDHRNNLFRSFNPEAPESVSYERMAEFKGALIAALSGSSSGVLLDPEYGVASCITSGAIAPGSGLLVAVEKTGYTGDPEARESQILPGWSVEKVARLGAAGVKLLVYYHPDAPNAPRQEALVREVGEACSKFDMPFFLEPLSFSLDPAKKKLATADKLAVVVETARRLSPLGVDVLKAEFPLDIAEERDEGAWATACAALSEASMVPWVLLSAGVSYETFERQVLVACQNGASGVLAGRAVWKEAVWLYGDARTEFLNTIARGRMNRLSAVVLEHGRAWTDHYPALADSFGEGWYKNF